MNTSKSLIHILKKLCSLKAAVTLLLIFIGVFSSTNLIAQVTLPLYDPIPTSYGDGTALGSGTSATVWSVGNSIGSGGMTNRSFAALSYPGLAASSGLGVVMPLPGSSGRDRGISLNSGTFGAGNPTLYASFLLNIQTTPTALRTFCFLRSSTGSGTPAIGLFVTTTNTLLLSKNSTTPLPTSTAVLTPGTTHLVVMRYKWTSAASGDDEVDLWLDPPSLGTVEGSVPGPNVSTTSGTDQTTLQGWRFQLQSSDTGVFWFDEVRIGLTWASVTPTGCTPPTAYTVTGGGAYCSGGSGLSVGLANSDVGIDYRLKLNSTESGAILPGTGAALDFGLQTVAGTYSISGSNTTTACIGSMTGNAVVTINNPSSISSSPTNQTVCSGATATFAVSATGAGLNYQWQVNAGPGFGNVSTGTGGTTPSYTTATLSPADDGSQYRCIVSGTCSPQATSGTATVNVSSGASVNSSPGDRTVSVGSTSTFTVGASGPGLGYQWQVSTDGGSTYNNVSVGAGGNTANYTTAALASTESGTKYKCILSASCGAPAESTPATLTVNPAIYRTVGSGAWSAATTWEQSYNGSTWVAGTTFPTSDNTSNILVQSGHLATVTNALSVDDLTISAAGEVDASGTTLTINDDTNAPIDCDVFGVLQVANVANSGLAVNSGAVVQFESGSHFIWNGPQTTVFPTATWADGSLCENQNGSTTTPTGLGQSFYDFYWNRTASGSISLSNQLTTVRHNLQMHGSSDSANSVRFLSSTAVNNLTVGGDVVIEGGFVTCSGNSTPNTVLNLIMGGNLMIESGATLDSRNSGAGSANNFMFTNTAVTQVISNSGTLGHTGSGGGTPNNWLVSNNVTVLLAVGNLTLGTANNSTRDAVVVDGTLNLGTNQITGPGNLTLNPGCALLGNGINQLTIGLNSITYGGTLNLGAVAGLSIGQSFKIFDAAAYTGSFASIIPAAPGDGLFWDTTQLTVDGTLRVSSSSGVNSSPTSITVVGTAGVLDLSWPADHTGWHLQVQTNSLLGNWIPVLGSDATNHVIIPIDHAAASVFYRLVLP